MPEGDTIWRTARTLEGVLVGRLVSGFHSAFPAVADSARRLGLVGQRVAAVESNGKHLLVRFSGGATLHTHLRMTGSWHLYRMGAAWRKPARAARVVIQAGEATAVCFSAPVVELLPPGRAAAHPGLRRLGPDLLAPGFAESEARERLRARPEVEVGAALLDQTALAGIGNVYKSEVCFLCGINPFRRVGDLDEAGLARLIETARREMRRNLGPGMRRTRSALSRERLWVYGRAGKPCLRCGTSVQRRLQGEQARATYWCPVCQPGSPRERAAKMDPGI
jgi:endonuclease-8